MTKTLKTPECMLSVQIFVGDLEPELGDTAMAIIADNWENDESQVLTLNAAQTTKLLSLLLRHWQLPS